MRYLSFEDSWQREDLAAFQGPDQRAEAALISIKPGQQGALDHPFNIERSLTTWSYLDTKPLSLGPSQRIPMRGRIAFSRSFALPDDNQSCAGFVSSWDFPGGDPQGRPGKLMFGYLCQSETPLDQATIDQFLRNIELREAAEPDASNGTETAQPTGSFGNNAFPFRLARRYIIGNGVIRQ